MNPGICPKCWYRNGYGTHCLKCNAKLSNPMRRPLPSSQKSIAFRTMVPMADFGKIKREDEK